MSSSCYDVLIYLLNTCMFHIDLECWLLMGVWILRCSSMVVCIFVFFSKTKKEKKKTCQWICRGYIPAEKYKDLRYDKLDECDLWDNHLMSLHYKHQGQVVECQKYWCIIKVLLVSTVVTEPLKSYVNTRHRFILTCMCSRFGLVLCFFAMRI